MGTRVGRPEFPVQIRRRDGTVTQIQRVRFDTGADVTMMWLSDARAQGLDTSGIRMLIPVTTHTGPVNREYIVGRLSVCIPVYDSGRWFDWPCHFLTGPTPCTFVLGLAGVTTDFRIGIDTGLTSPIAPCGMLVLE